jgi:hypothetical protein
MKFAKFVYFEDGANEINVMYAKEKANEQGHRT